MKKSYRNTAIRHKIILLLTVFFLVSAILSYTVLKQIITPSFVAIEEQEAIRQTEQVVNAIDDEVVKLDTLCHDWANWDDTYNFILTRDPAYIISNMQDETLINAGLNLIVFFESSGKIVYQKGLDLESRKQNSFTEFSQGHITRQTLEFITAFGNVTPIEAVVSGLYRSSEGLLLLSCRPILTSKDDGPIHGYLLMAKLYNAGLTDQLCKRTAVNFTTAESSIQDKGGVLTKAQYPDREIFLDQHEPHLLHGLTEILGIDQKHALTIKISMARQISDQGTQSIHIAILAIIVTGALTLILTLFFFHQLVAGPLNRLVTHMGNITNEMDFSSRLAAGKDYHNDEIGFLASQFNKLLDAIEFSYDQLEDINSQQEEEISQRKKLEAALRENQEKLEHLATHDELTGIPNRRVFNLELEKQWHLARREQWPLTVIMCDIDCFKLYNDTYGHPAGDSCLQQIATGLGKALQRPLDMVARYGGEEFIIMLPKTPEEGAMKVAEEIRKAIFTLAIPHDTSVVAPYVTLSLGVMSLIPSAAMQIEDLIKMADDALYKAKNQGRNKVVSAVKA